MKPIFNNVVIKPLKEEVTKSGIILPDKEDDKPYKGIVIAVGDCKFVKEGDTVIFKRYSPEVIEIEGETYLQLSEENITIII